MSGYYSLDFTLNLSVSRREDGDTLIWDDSPSGILMTIFIHMRFSARGPIGRPQGSRPPKIGELFSATNYDPSSSTEWPFPPYSP